MAAGALTVLLGCGALAVDVSYIRLAQAQAQDVVDAASVAALWAARATGDLADGEAAAQAILNLNPVVGGTATLQSIEFGDWDSVDRTLSPDELTPNAVRVTLGRVGDNAVPLFLGRLFGWDEINVVRSATAASRDLQVVLVMDITNSWSRPNFYRARDAAVAFYDVLENSHGPGDMIGMNVFTGRYAWEFTPLVSMESEDISGNLRAQWSAMETASKAGTAANNSRGCNVNGTNNFASPDGGCFPDMPREYKDEPGTDHSTGLAMARTMFEDNDQEGVYRAIVVLTDGQPNGISASHGNTRRTTGFEEERWREYLGPIPHSSSQVRDDSVTATEELWDDLEVNSWVVTFVTDSQFLEDMAQGDGYYVRTSSSAALVTIFEDIASSLPIAVVE